MSLSFLLNIMFIANDRQGSGLFCRLDIALYRGFAAQVLLDFNTELRLAVDNLIVFCDNIKI